MFTDSIHTVKKCRFTPRP